MNHWNKDTECKVKKKRVHVCAAQRSYQRREKELFLGVIGACGGRCICGKSVALSAKRSFNSLSLMLTGTSGSWQRSGVFTAKPTPCTVFCFNLALPKEGDVAIWFADASLFGQFCFTKSCSVDTVAEEFACNEGRFPFRSCSSTTIDESADVPCFKNGYILHGKKPEMHPRYKPVLWVWNFRIDH